MAQPSRPQDKVIEGTKAQMIIFTSEQQSHKVSAVSPCKWKNQLDQSF